MTEGCLTLRDKTKELIQAGHLQKFVKRGADFWIRRSKPRFWQLEEGAVVKNRMDAKEGANFAVGLNAETIIEAQA
ncbi:hypothetical protein CR513_04375, partial [Mucuna pruriens]